MKLILITLFFISLLSTFTFGKAAKELERDCFNCETTTGNAVEKENCVQANANVVIERCFNSKDQNFYGTKCVTTRYNNNKTLHSRKCGVMDSGDSPTVVPVRCFIIPKVADGEYELEVCSCYKDQCNGEISNLEKKKLTSERPNVNVDNGKSHALKKYNIASFKCYMVISIAVVTCSKTHKIKFI